MGGYRAGLTPLLSSPYEIVHAMGIPVLLKSPEARKLLWADDGEDSCDDGVTEIESSESSQEEMPPPKKVPPKVVKVQEGNCV